MKKKPASGKCPECKGTGEQFGPPTYPPRRMEHVPRYKCTECDGTGKAQPFEMFFWHYDQFPYCIASRGFMRDDGLCYAPSFNACFRPFMSLPLKEGGELKAWLEELEQEHKRTLQSVGAGFRARLEARVPKAIKK
jgi:hypothetical protein